MESHVVFELLLLKRLLGSCTLQFDADMCRKLGA
jgi:hypothetical protein